MRAKILLVAQDEPHREAPAGAKRAQRGSGVLHSFAMREFVTGEHGDARDVAEIAAARCGDVGAVRVFLGDRADVGCHAAA